MLSAAVVIGTLRVKLGPWNLVSLLGLRVDHLIKQTLLLIMLELCPFSTLDFVWTSILVGGIVFYKHNPSWFSCAGSETSEKKHRKKEKEKKKSKSKSKTKEDKHKDEEDGKIRN